MTGRRLRGHCQHCRRRSHRQMAAEQMAAFHAKPCKVNTVIGDTPKIAR